MKTVITCRSQVQRACIHIDGSASTIRFHSFTRSIHRELRNADAIVNQEVIRSLNAIIASLHGNRSARNQDAALAFSDFRCVVFIRFDAVTGCCREVQDTAIDFDRILTLESIVLSRHGNRRSAAEFIIILDLQILGRLNTVVIITRHL